MKKKITFALLFLLSSLILSKNVCAQVGFLPEFLGNAAPAMPGLSLKFFPSYFYQQGSSGHDVEAAFEPQYWIPGFTGDIKKDVLQFVVHLPVGYMNQQDPITGRRTSVTGIGTLTTTIEYYWHFIDTEDLQFWFDNGITGGYPTATNHQGMQITGDLYTMRFGGDAFSVGWYQESYVRYKKFVASIMPIAAGWAFEDEDTGVRNGLSLSVMNGSAGYQVNDWATLGLSFGLLLGGVAGDKDLAGRGLPMTMRFYVGPAALISFNDDTALQASVLIDAVKKNTNRWMGIAIGLWHHF